MVVAVALVLGGAGGASWSRLQRGPEIAAQPPPNSLVSFEPFVANLADPVRTRFLRLTLQLVVENEAQALAIDGDEVRRTRLRSSILELLTKQSADRLLASDGKAELRNAVSQLAIEIAPGVKVIDVLFTEFVVQY